MFTKVCHRHLVYAARNFDIKQVQIIGAAFCGGQKKAGTELGPDALREHGIVDAITKTGCNVIDVGNLKLNHKPGQSLTECSLASKKVYEAVRDGAEKQNFILTLGGDHSISTGTIAGLLDVYPDLHVIWIDAHADINTPMKSDSGSVHGMPLSFVTEGVQISPKDYECFSWARNRLLKNSSLHYVGLRDLDRFEKITIQRNKIETFDSSFVEIEGINRVMDELKVLLEAGLPILVSFDVDSLDPIYTPCTGTPVRGGLTLREVITLVRFISNYGHVVGLDVMEVNPSLAKYPGDLENTLNNTLEVVKHFF